MTAVKAGSDDSNEYGTTGRLPGDRLEEMRKLADAFADFEREDSRRQSLWEINAQLYGDDGLPK